MQHSAASQPVTAAKNGAAADAVVTLSLAACCCRSACTAAAVASSAQELLNGFCVLGEWDVGAKDDAYKDDIESAATKENADLNVKGTTKPGRAAGKQNRIRAALEAKASNKAGK
ncbi:TPA: hypothetical protein ACH3X2_004233 [Trebouxia sp. C0005]